MKCLYLTTHSAHFTYGYMASDIWAKDHSDSEIGNDMGYSFRLAARVLLYAPSHRQDSTYHGLCCTNRGALAGTRNISMGPPLRIDPMIHRTMSEGATSELRPAPHISLMLSASLSYCWTV